MRVLHLGTDDYAGGAARAMFRWHVSLCKLGVESEILCLNKSSGDERVTTIVPDWQSESAFEDGALQRFFIESNRTDYSDTFFSHPLGYASIADHESVRRADIIHVHWTSLFFRWQELRRIKSSGKSIVLTPHDLWPITGGCHYPGACDGYLKECLNCPMLGEDPFQFVSKSRALKQNVLSETIDVILSPSQWMDATFRKVAVLEKVTKIVIPYCIDAEQFAEQSKEQSKEELGFEPRRQLVLFCANNVSERRKGLDQLIAVLKICEDRSELRKVLAKHADIVLIGKGSDRGGVSTTFRTHGRGYVEGTADLNRYYSAADLMIYLGLEDNLPNVILESMARGTPVLAFNTGGVGDLIACGETGELVPSGDVERFAATMAVLLDDPKRLSWMGMNSREKAWRQFSEGVVGLALREFYQRLTRQLPDPVFDRTPFPEDRGFENAAQETIQAALAKGCRSLEQEFKARLANADKETHLLRGYLEESQSRLVDADKEIHLLRGYFEESQSRIADLDKEIHLLRGYFEESQSQIIRLCTELEQERGKTLWRRLKEKFPRIRRG
jgi:glycosyltransferase involved in cell wall biosynthesis